MKLELLYPAWVILCAATGALLGNVNGYGTFRGLSDGVIVAMLPIFFLMIGLGIMSLWRPLLPPCRCGQCNHKGYRYAGYPTAPRQADKPDGIVPNADDRISHATGTSMNY